MNTRRDPNLQDIYATDNETRDDYTPHVASEVIEERKREIQRHRSTGIILGMIVLTVTVALGYVVIREYIDLMGQNTEIVPKPITQEYIPRYSLPQEAQWVLDFSRNYASPSWDGEVEPPFNVTSVKKAAFNIILAEQAVEISEFGEAAKYYRNALEILPDLEGIKIPLGMAYFRLEQFEEALMLLENISDTELTHDVLCNLGAVCIELEAYEKSEAYLKRSLALNPTYLEASRNMAMLYQKQNRMEDAEKAYEQYLSLRPHDTNTRHSFALYLIKIGRWERAAEQLIVLTKEAPDDINLYRLLVQVQMKRGDNNAALVALQRVTQLSDPKMTLGWMNEKEFDQLRQNAQFQELMKHINN